MQRNTSRILFGLIGALVLGVGTASATSADPSGPSISGRCGDVFTPTIPGAEAFWAIHCTHPPKIDRVRGWVKDTRMDGYAAMIHFTDGGGHPIYYPRASGWGESKVFEFDAAGAEVNGELSLGW